MADYRVLLAHVGPGVGDQGAWNYHADDLPAVGDVIDLVLVESANLDAVGETCRARVTSVAPGQEPPVSAEELP